MSLDLQRERERKREREKEREREGEEVNGHQSYSPECVSRSVMSTFPSVSVASESVCL